MPQPRDRSQMANANHRLAQHSQYYDSQPVRAAWYYQVWYLQSRYSSVVGRRGSLIMSQKYLDYHDILLREADVKLLHGREWLNDQVNVLDDACCLCKYSIITGLNSNLFIGDILHFWVSGAREIQRQWVWFHLWHCRLLHSKYQWVSIRPLLLLLLLLTSQADPAQVL